MKSLIVIIVTLNEAFDLKILYGSKPFFKQLNEDRNKN